MPKAIDDPTLDQVVKVDRINDFAYLGGDINIINANAILCHGNVHNLGCSDAE